MHGRQGFTIPVGRSIQSLGPTPNFMGSLEDLEFIYSRIRAVNSEPREFPGMDRTEVQKRFLSADLVPHPFLVDLYAWRNGIDNVNAFLYFLPLDEAFKRYDAMLRMTHRDWKPTWFPFLDLNGNVWFCIDVETGEFVEIDIEGDREEILATDYRKFISAVTEMFREDRMVFDSGCFEVADDEVWEETAVRHGVTSAWW
jgi:hypothetical protein